MKILTRAAHDLSILTPGGTLGADKMDEISSDEMINDDKMLQLMESDLLTKQ